MVGPTVQSMTPGFTAQRKRYATRRGLSYLEVLIAAGIGLAGLLGAIALFPVAILNLQRGVVSDTVAAVGPSALEQAQATGVTTPANWLAYNYGTASWQNDATVQLSSLPYTSNPNAIPFGPWVSVCIDPRLAAEFNASDVSNASINNSIGQFPYVGATDSTVEARMLRLTLRQFPGAGLPMTVNQARLLMKSSDDLISTRPADKTQPAVLEMLTGSAGNVRRDYNGNFEWMMTLSPKVSGVMTWQATPNGMNPNPPVLDSNGVSPLFAFAPTRQYRASVVVFNQRLPRLDAFLVNSGDAPDTERLASVTFLGGGFNGGDVTIQTRAGRPIQDLALNAGDWVMLSGILQSIDNTKSPRIITMQSPLFQWYRVASTQGEAEVVAGVNQRFVTLEGPDWPIAQVTGGTQMTIVSGVVGVYEHLITLQ